MCIQNKYTGPNISLESLYLVTAPLCIVDASVVEWSKSRPAIEAGAARRRLARAARRLAPPALALRLLAGRLRPVYQKEVVFKVLFT